MLLIMASSPHVPCPPALNLPDTIFSHHHTSQDPTHFLLPPPQLQPTMNLAIMVDWEPVAHLPLLSQALCACATPSRQIPSSWHCFHPCSWSSSVPSHLPLIASCPQPSVAPSPSKRHLCTNLQAHLLGSTWMQNCRLLPRMLPPIPGTPQSGAAAYTAPTFPRPIHFSVPFCLAPTSASPLPNLLLLCTVLPNPGCVSSLLLKGCSAVLRPFARNSVPYSLFGPRISRSSAFPPTPLAVPSQPPQELQLLSQTQEEVELVVFVTRRLHPCS